ncbi:hypothetical protein HanPI659440_Chr01g0020541 [Helianthus annuus]|nr:hypothetical protein HanPI659440_Chr01g0020541 [Helianthus annuus]
MVEWYKVDKTNLTRNSFRPLAYIVPKRRRIAGIVVGPPYPVHLSFFFLRLASEDLPFGVTVFGAEATVISL